MKKFLIKNCSLVIALGIGSSVICFGADSGCKSCKPKQEVKQEKAMTQQNASKRNNPLEKELAYTSGKGTLSLAELLKDKKAVLLDFYATWCGPCMKEMPKLQEKAKILRPQGIEVVGINVDPDDSENAEKLRKERGIDFHWVIEQGVHSKHFDITTIPTVVLLSQTGEVLFKGNPGDSRDHAKLKEALTRLGVSL